MAPRVCKTKAKDDFQDIWAAKHYRKQLGLRKVSDARWYEYFVQN